MLGLTAATRLSAYARWVTAWAPLHRCRPAPRASRTIIAAAGLPPGEWTPREMRHSFVSLLSDSGVPLEHISRLVGHSGTAVTETVYRQQLRPVLDEGAVVMDAIFPSNASHSDSHSARVG